MRPASSSPVHAGPTTHVSIAPPDADVQPVRREDPDPGGARANESAAITLQTRDRQWPNGIYMPGGLRIK